MENNELEFLKQRGPTCGIYAIAMIIRALYPKHYPDPQDGELLANGIYKIAIDSGLSEVGELFDVITVIELLEKVNNQILSKNENKLYYEIIEIENLENTEEIAAKLENILSDEKYILFPYKPGFFDVGHWGALYKIEDTIVSGKQGRKDLEDSNGENSLNEIEVSKLLDKHIRLSTKYFSWKKYFWTKKININLWLSSVFFIVCTIPLFCMNNYFKEMLLKPGYIQVNLVLIIGAVISLFFVIYIYIENFITVREEEKFCNYLELVSEGEKIEYNIRGKMIKISRK